MCVCVCVCVCVSVCLLPHFRRYHSSFFYDNRNKLCMPWHALNFNKRDFSKNLCSKVMVLLQRSA